MFSDGDSPPAGLRIQEWIVNAHESPTWIVSGVAALAKFGWEYTGVFFPIVTLVYIATGVAPQFETIQNLLMWAGLVPGPFPTQVKLAGSLALGPTAYDWCRLNNNVHAYQE